MLALAAAELTQQQLLNRAARIEPRSSAVFTFWFQTLLDAAYYFLLGFRAEIFPNFTPPILPHFLVVAVIGSVGMILYLQSFKVQSISFSCFFL